MKLNRVLCAIITTTIIVVPTNVTATETVADAMNSGKFYSDFRLRHESVAQDNALKNASALTLRSRLGFNSANVNGFSATFEFEDSRVIYGQDNYAVPVTGFNTGEYSVIAGPETTEVDQMFIKYNTDNWSTKVGRQVLTMNNHRMVGHVGWRQDRQTFDGVSAAFKPADDLTVDVAYLTQRNRIFAETADLDSSDLLLNIGYKTDIASLKFYLVNLELNDVNNSENDTFGILLDGTADNIAYYAEFASQETANNAADYYNLILGTTIEGFSLKAGYEVLGSDNGSYGFSTPLATLHKFNGWADIFLGTPANGLADFSLKLGTKLGEGNFLAAYHYYEADIGGSDYGTELNLQWVVKFAGRYSMGVKAAFYSADGYSVDTDKIWVWFGASF